MFTYHARLMTLCGDEVNDRIHVTEEHCPSGVVAVSVSALARPRSQGMGTIHPELGLSIELETELSIESYMANYRSCEFWCSPAFGNDLSKIPDETQLLLCRLTGGEYLVLLPVVNDKYKSVLYGTPEGRIAVRCFSRYSRLYTCRGLSFLYARGMHPHALIETCVREALRLLNNGTKHRTERRYPEILEYLGWCSWDSMQIRVNEEGILQKCEEFKTKGIPVKWAMIDDMWAEVRDFYGESYADTREMIGLMHRSALWHFEADPIRFPKGLAHTVAKVKEYGIRVGMWHPTTGYWRGIDPEGEAYRVLKDTLIETPEAMLVPDWHADKSYLYYKTIHDFFSAAGVDFVKIDNQSMSRRYYAELAPVGEVCREFHDGMEASVGAHFDNAMINCMGMASEDLWNRRQSPVSRCSGDFQPENRAWFQKHVLQCAYNSLLQGELYWCDWDMWWTDDAQGPKNSLLRAISGGPIYVSDEIGRSRAELFAPLALSNGRILRPDRPATPCEDCLVEDATNNGKALKIQNTVRSTYGILAALNIDSEERAVKTTVRAQDIEGLPVGEYAVYEHFSGECRILRPGESFDVTLASPDDYRLYIFAPLVNGFAVIGRTDKFISPATIASVDGERIRLLEDGPYAYVKDGKPVLCNQNK